MGSAKVFESAAAVIHPDFSGAKPLNYSAAARLSPSPALSPTKL